MKLNESEQRLIETVRVYRAIRRQAVRSGAYSKDWGKHSESVYSLAQADLMEALNYVGEQ